MGASKTTAYSLPGARYFGSSNVTLVAVSPVVDVVIWSGYNVFDSPTKFKVGIPSSTVLIWTSRGSFPSGLLAK